MSDRDSDKYALKSVRSSPLNLDPHPESCELDQLRDRFQSSSKPLAIDLFGGAGGLSLGLQEAGFSVILGVDNYQQSQLTHKAHFPGASVLADLADDKEIDRICEALKGLDISLVAGGPPCQPYSRAGRNKIRSLVQEGSWNDGDWRKNLWQSFYQFVERLSPSAVLLENVPEMSLGEDTRQFRQLVAKLERLEYGVFSRILSCAKYGVPQLRNRLIVVGIKDKGRFEWPSETSESITIRDAIGDLPRVEEGADQNPRPYDKPITEFQRDCRKLVPSEESTVIYDHVARRVRQDDLEAFRLMNSETKYSDLPESLTRYDTTKYVDKYNRQAYDKVGRTITAHMAKDGYWYIHPEQDRTFTIREAARLQTFPDHFRFSGYPSNVYRQIGEAVPPVFGKAIGECIYEVLRHPDAGRVPVATGELSKVISDWLRNLDTSEFISPWRQISLSSAAHPIKIWQVLMGMILLGKISSTARRQNLWPVLMEEFQTPNHYLESPSREHLVKICGRGRLFPELDALAIALSSEGVSGESNHSEKISIGYLKEAVGICPPDAGMSAPVANTGTVRAAKRIFGSIDDADAPGSNTLLISLVLGDSDDGSTAAGLLEIGEKFCKPGVPDCDSCPLSGICLTGKDMVLLDGQARFALKSSV